MAEAEPKRFKVDKEEPVTMTKKVQNLEMKEQIEISIRLAPLPVSGSREVPLIESTVDGYKIKVKYQLRDAVEPDHSYDCYFGGRRVVVGDRANPDVQPQQVVAVDRMGTIFRRRGFRGSGVAVHNPYTAEYHVEVVIISEQGNSGYTVDLSLLSANDSISRFDRATGQMGTTLRLKTTAASVATNGAIIACKICGTMSPAAFRPDAYLHAKSMMNQMYLERETTGDLTLETKTGAHKVHGWLLSRQSEMFDAMLTHNMKEKQDRVVKMDFEDAVVLNLIEFVYTGWTDSVNTDPQSLLSIAHMFQVDTLITRCWDTFMANLTTDTAVSLLLLADKLGAVEQKKTVGKFLLDNHDAIRKTDEFKQLVNQYSRLYLEICDM